MTGRHEMQDTVARALCRKNCDEPCKFCTIEAGIAVIALAEAGYLASPRTMGRCGEPAPTLGIVTGYSICALPAGHGGWHEDDAGAQWTPSPIEDLIEASSLGTPGAKALRASVSDEQAQRAIDRANEIRAAEPGLEPSRDCLIVDRDNDVYRYDENAWACLTESNSGSWLQVCRLYGPIRVYAPKTDDGAGASPAANAVPHGPAAQAGQTIGSPAPSSPRLFELVRSRDVSGVTGTGSVADGVVWTDSTVTLRWKGDHPATAVWDSVESILAVHGHEGATVVRWLDGEPA